MTRPPVSALRSVDLETPDIEKSTAFYAGIWGLDIVADAPGSVWLRATGADHHVLALHQAAAPALRAITFRVPDRADLDAIAAKAGLDAILLGPSADPGPAGGTILTLREPQGGILRFVHGDIQHSDARAIANRPLRLSHVNVNSPDVDAAMGYYERILGFRKTDRSPIMGFVTCNPDHHVIVIATAPHAGLNHIAFMMPDLESVMRGAGRLVTSGHPIGWGVGRHGPGDNVFAYFLDPHGVVVEYTAEVLQIDDTYVIRPAQEWAWPPGRIDHWGIAPPKPDHVKHAQLAVRHAGEPHAA